MEKFLFVFTHLGLPLLTVFVVFNNKPGSRTGLLANLLFFIPLLWFLYLWGQWPIALSVYAKYAVLAVIFLVFYRIFKLYGRPETIFPKTFFGYVRNLFLLLFGGLFVFLIVRFYQGQVYREEAVGLQFPLKNGTYYISSGGSNTVINNHYGRGGIDQQYAIDINKIGPWGSISSWSSEHPNKDHHIFGEPVFAPCDGRVVEMENRVEDNLGSSMSVTREQGRGNYVFMRCDSVIVSMVHLKKGSVQVRIGEYVPQGSLLGQVGNSGFSQEPHLHFQAARYTKDSVLLGLPVQFGGERPVRNDLITH